MINPRAETVAGRPASRTALRRRRCPALTYRLCEWRKSGSSGQPMRAVMRSGEVFALAGLWETWRTQRRGSPVLHDHNDRGKRSSEAGPRPNVGDSVEGG